MSFELPTRPATSWTNGLVLRLKNLDMSLSGNPTGLPSKHTVGGSGPVFSSPGACPKISLPVPALGSSGASQPQSSKKRNRCDKHSSEPSVKDSRKLLIISHVPL